MLYCPASNCVPSNVALACVVSPDVFPLVKEAVPRTIVPLLKVISPVGGEPTPDALTVAVSDNDCAVCWEVSAVLVATCEIAKLMGVKFELVLKLLSP